MSGRLPLLRRIGTLREIEHRAAARAATQAEASRADLGLLTDRTLSLTRGYAIRAGATDGGALSERLRFAGALRTIHESNLADLARARATADERLALLAQAGRRRDAVHDQIAADNRRQRGDAAQDRLIALVSQTRRKHRDGGTP